MDSKNLWWIITVIFLSTTGCFRKDQQSEELSFDGLSIEYREIETPVVDSVHATPPKIVVEKDGTSRKLKISFDTNNLFQLGINNQWSAITGENEFELPMNLNDGEYYVMLAPLAADSSKFVGEGKVYYVGINSEYDPFIQPSTAPHLWMGSIKKEKGKVYVTYAVANRSSPLYGSVRIYLNDRYLLEQEQQQKIELSGLSRGTHKIRFVLTDPKGQVLKEPFAKMERQFTY